MIDTEIVEIPRDVRRRKTVTAIAVTLGLVGLFVGTMWALDFSLSYADLLVIVPVLVFGGVKSLQCWRTTKILPPIPEVIRKPGSEDADITSKWYFRYCVAGLLLLLAWYLSSTAPQSIQFLVAIAFAAMLAYELSLVLIAVCAVWFIGLSIFDGLQNIGSLPVSTAIIIGAVIIASAMGGRK